jgi:hypothetical protein
MADYHSLSRINFLPELEALDLHGKARVIQSLLEESYFHPSGLFYSKHKATHPMTPRENMLSLYRRTGYEWAPVSFHLCPTERTT